MCLFLYGRETKYRTFLNKKSVFAKKIQNTDVKEVTCWKVYKILNNSLISLIQGFPIRKAGVIKSNRESPDLTETERRDGYIVFGIHVYKTKEEAQRDAVAQWHRLTVVVPVICRTSDFVAEGYGNEAIFMKVRIRSRTWNKIFGNKE